MVQKVRSTDIRKSAALSLHHAILEESFVLDDKFCDDDDLETSWKKKKISDKFMTFSSTLFNIKKSLMLADPVFNETHLQSPGFVEDDIDTKRKNENIKFTKLISIYQIIFYILHPSKKKTPLHMMTVHAIYNKCKSRELIASFNHIGVCVSYTDAMRKGSCPHTLPLFQRHVHYCSL